MVLPAPFGPITVTMRPLPTSRRASRSTATLPYRRWPEGAAAFHDMMRRATPMSATAAHEVGMIDALADDYAGLMTEAVARVRAFAGRPAWSDDGVVHVEPPAPIEPVAANGQRLSSEAIGILDAAICDAAAAPTFAAALEIGYRAFAASACTAAAREGIDAFLQRRPPDFSKTG